MKGGRSFPEDEKSKGKRKEGRRVSERERKKRKTKKLENGLVFVVVCCAHTEWIFLTFYLLHSFVLILLLLL